MITAGGSWCRVRRHELSDAEWEFVRPLLPASLRGRKRLDDRRVLNGIVWKFRTGTAWRDVPERYGPWATLHTRFRRWAADGTFDRMLQAAQAKADAAGDIEWLVSVDSTIVRAHQHAAGGLSLDGTLPDGASSVALRCRRPDGTPAVLKNSPEKPLMAEQADMLGWFAASGRVPSVLAAGEAAGAKVLEGIIPGTPAEDMPAAALPDQWSELLAALHEVALPPRLRRVLRGRCEEAFARVGKRLSEPAVSARMDATVWDRAIQRCERLLETEATTDCSTVTCTWATSSTADSVVSWPLIRKPVPVIRASTRWTAAATREQRVSMPSSPAAARTSCGLDSDRLHAWSQVIAPFAAIAHLRAGGERQTVDELLALVR